MIELRFPAFRVDRKFLAMTEVVDWIDGSPWRWWLLYFEGTLKSKSGLDVAGSHSYLDYSSQGLDYSWSALIDFARSMFQPFDVTLVAFDAADRCALVLEVIDSSYWRVLADDAVPEAVASLEALRRFQHGYCGE